MFQIKGLGLEISDITDTFRAGGQTRVILCQFELYNDNMSCCGNSLFDYLENIKIKQVSAGFK